MDYGTITMLLMGKSTISMAIFKFIPQNMVIITVMIYKPWMIFHRLCLHLLDSIDNYDIQILLKFLISTKDNVQWIMMVIVGIVIYSYG